MTPVSGELAPVWLAGAVITPLLAAGIVLLLGRRAEPWGPLLASTLTALSTILLAHHVRREGPFRHEAGGWGAPLGLELRVDGLASVMLALTAVICLLVAAFSRSLFRVDPRHAPWFWPLFLFLWAGLNLLFATADVFNAYVALEMVSVAAVALVTLEGGAKALSAGLRYLLVALAGSLAYLLAVALLYAEAATLDFALLAEQATAGPTLSLALALATVGLFAKAALFPLHAWLPPAHAAAPAPASALLSALVVKGSFYLLVRLWFEVFSAAGALPGPRTLVGLCGTAAMFWGSILALRQTRLKAMLAHSTVAQLGYLLLLFPLADQAAAWTGAATHAAAHALAKAAMFSAAGLIVYAAGHDRVASIGGAAQALPMTVFAFAIAGLSLVGLPPSGGFVAKWLMVSAAFESGRWWWGLVPLLGGLLAAGYVFGVLARAFARPPRDLSFKPVPLGAELAVLTLAVASMLVGFLVAGPLGELVAVTSGRAGWVAAR